MISEHELENLRRYGIQFTVHLFDGNYDLSSKEVLEYINSPELVEAKVNGVTFEHWIKWKNHVSRQECHAITKKGRPCKGHVHQLSLKDFISKDCVVFCKMHDQSKIR